MLLITDGEIRSYNTLELRVDGEVVDLSQVGIVTIMGDGELEKGREIIRSLKGYGTNELIPPEEFIFTKNFNEPSQELPRSPFRTFKGLDFDETTGVFVMRNKPETDDGESAK